MARRALRGQLADDRAGTTTQSDIEPLRYVGTAAHWDLVARCRLRGGVRAFRVDRITAVSATGEKPGARTLAREDLDIPYGVVTRLDLN